MLRLYNRRRWIDPTPLTAGGSLFSIPSSLEPLTSFRSSHHRRYHHLLLNDNVRFCSSRNNDSDNAIQLGAFRSITTKTNTMSTASTTSAMRMKNEENDHVETTTTTTTTMISRVHMPLLTRDGTLLLRCQQPNNNEDHTTIANNTSTTTTTTNVRFVPSMNREDVIIEIFSVSRPVKKDDDDDDDKSVLSSVGVDESIEYTNLDDTIITPYLHVTNHTNGKYTSDGRLGSYAEVDIVPPTSAAIALTDRVVVITTPEKFNITCQLHAGDISIEHGNKMEGDVHLSTRYGNINIGCKVRGYEVTLNTMTDGTTSPSSSTEITNDEMTRDKGNIYVRKVIEAKTLDVRSSARVRARMLNVGSKLSIVATPATSDDAMSSSADIHTYTKLDDDDEGAVIDIGSIYIVTSGLGMDDNDARLIVNGSTNHHTRGLVRVKSSHGHIVIHAKTNRLNYYTPPITTSESSDSTMTPLIDLGGVNGSCDVLLEGISSSSLTSSSPVLDQYVSPTSTTPTMRVHFDALSPESISTITSRGILLKSSDTDDDVIPSLTSITMDRKLETEIRLLSAVSRMPTTSGISDCVVDAHDITSEDEQDVNKTLLKIAKEKAIPLLLGDSQREQPMISIETDAYIDGEYANLDGEVERTTKSPHHGGRVQYLQGTMSNRSGEPDARSDIRGKGKINVDGAALQALQGFQSGKKQSSSTSSSSLLPLLAVATDGGIKLETLSWFGSIARRYGLDATEADSKKVELLGSLGRQARRVPRLEK